MNILITGCNGQLGNELQNMQAESPSHTYYNTDIQDSAEGVVNYSRLDITDAAEVEAFVEEHDIDGIINCAAYTAVDKAEEDTTLCHKLNATAPGILAEAISRRAGWMIQVSTDYVFDGTSHRPYTEDDAPCPASVYGTTKLEGERAVMERCEKAMVVRTAWLYSEYGKNFVKTMLTLGETKERLGVVFDQIGTPTYALDLAAFIMTAVEKGVTPGIYHFTDEGVTSWYDFTKAIHRIAGITTCHVSPLHTVEYPTPASRPAYSVLDKTKAKTTYAFDIPHWEEALEKCIANIRGGKTK